MKSGTEVLCLECGEEIFNPLCPKCLAREIDVWLENQQSKIKKSLRIPRLKSRGLFGTFGCSEMQRPKGRGFNRISDIKKTVKGEIKKILEVNKEHNYTKCILCKRKDVFLCPYCFTERIYNRLKNARINSKILSNFLTLFNFDLEHTGYSKDIQNTDGFDNFDDSEDFNGFGYDNERAM
jgi:hypothetical protein